MRGIALLTKQAEQASDRGESVDQGQWTPLPIISVLLPRYPRVMRDRAGVFQLLATSGAAASVPELRLWEG